MTAHTPGPWHQYAGCGPQVCARGHANQFIADCKGTLNAENNARLIAAAPDLLAALQTLIELHQSWSAGSASIRKVFVERNDAAIVAARAAVAKATGNTD